MDGKLTIEIDPDAKALLDSLLMTELMGTGIGYSEFIRRSVGTWRRMKPRGRPCEYEECGGPSSEMVEYNGRAVPMCEDHKERVSYRAYRMNSCPNCGCYIPEYD